LDGSGLAAGLKEEATMDDDRNVGVTEARFALTLVTCALVAAGYLAISNLTNLGKSDESTIEVQTTVVQQVPIVKEEEGPRVLPSDEGTRMTKRAGENASGVTDPKLR
jgi:hypothetical protein